MTFAFPSLLWLSVPLLAVTLAVHLLNLHRQKPIAWAAMEFLLQSERINRTWINLKQWLLLAVRMLAIALAVFALAGPRLQEFSLGALTERRSLHVVVLDDSYSMSDTGATTSAWQDALAATDRVLAFASEKSGQEVAIIRTSALSSATTASDRGEIAKLRESIASWKPSQLSPLLLPALEKASQIVEAAPSGVRSTVYLVTDGRQKDAEPLAALSKRIESLQDTGAVVRWVTCVASQSDNLTLGELELLPGPQAAGVELTMRVSVTNNGPATAAGALVSINRDGRSSPSIEMGAIESGRTAWREFAVLFREPGVHRVTAELEADAVEADNVRYAAFDLAAERKVLLVDGSERRQEGAPYAAALRPNERLNTGWRPELVSVAEAAGQTDFSTYAAIFLLDVPRLPEATAAALSQFAKSGGGMFVALGPNANRQFYNEWLLSGSKSPLFPVTLTKVIKPKGANGDGPGDLVVTDHPLFKVFAGDRDSFLDLVSVNYCQGVQEIEEDSSVRVLASHRGGEPLLIENGADAGRAVLMLSTIGQSQRRDESWSNLSTLPVFPIFALELAAYLAQPAYESPGFEVGQPWTEVVSIPPDARVRIGRVESVGAVVKLIEAAGAELAALPGPEEAGAYQVEATTQQGVQSTPLAANVAPQEGDLRLAPPKELSAMLNQLGVQVETGVALSADGEDGPSPLPPLLGMIAIALLLGEQMLAVSASYHEPTRGRIA